MFFKRRKTRLERARDRIQDLAESGKDEARRRAPTERRDDTEHLSFIGGLMLGLVVSVLVALVVSNLSAESNEARRRQIGIHLLPSQGEDDTNTSPAATG